MLIGSAFNAVYEMEFPVMANTTPNDSAQLPGDVFAIMKRSSELYEQWVLAESAYKADPHDTLKAQTRQKLITEIEKLTQHHSRVSLTSSLPTDAASRHSG